MFQSTDLSSAFRQPLFLWLWGGPLLLITGPCVPFCWLAGGPMCPRAWLEGARGAALGF